MRQHLAESRPTSSRHVTDDEPVAMTTPTPLTSSSSVRSSVVTSTEPSTTTHASDDHERADSANVADNYEAQNDDEECICDYDQPTESRFDYVDYNARNRVVVYDLE